MCYTTWCLSLQWSAPYHNQEHVVPKCILVQDIGDLCNFIPLLSTEQTILDFSYKTTRL